jgi:hypothetical protein
MSYDWIKLCIKNMKGSTIENHVSGFFIKSLTFFQRFIIKPVGVFGVVSPYLASHVLNLILHSTHNSFESSHIFSFFFFSYFSLLPLSFFSLSFLFFSFLFSLSSLLSFLSSLLSFSRMRACSHTCEKLRGIAP